MATRGTGRRDGRGTGAAARRTGRARGGGSASAARNPRSGRRGGGGFKLSSTPRAAILALLVCALALSVAMPLRTYLSQREALQQEHQRQAQYAQQVQQLQARQAQLTDPVRREAEIRRRLGYVRPGETPYIVQAPAPPGPPPPQQQQQQEVSSPPWYRELWTSITGSEP